jgi:hypothetical protein
MWQPAAGQTTTTAAGGSGLWWTAADVGNSSGCTEDGGGRRRFEEDSGAVDDMVCNGGIKLIMWVGGCFNPFFCLLSTRGHLFFLPAFYPRLPPKQNTNEQNPGRSTRGYKKTILLVDV